MKKLTLILSMLIALVGFNANSALYIVGDDPFAGWHTNSGTPMVDNGDGTWSYVVTISKKNVYFSFADGFTATDGDWSGFQAYRYGPTSDGQVVNSDGNWVSTQHSGNAYKFYGDGEYVFTFDENNGSPRFKIEGYVAPVEITTYTVVLGIENWTVDEANDMTLNNGIYEFGMFGVQLNAGNFEYKVVGNHDWGFEWPSGYGNNFVETVPATGVYDVEITFDPATGESTCTLTLAGEPVGDTYTVAGTENLTGFFWDPTQTANDMELVEGLYTWENTGVELAKGDTIKFKVVMNHSWDVASWPENDWEYVAPSDGAYSFLITFNPETQEVNFQATPPSGTEDYYIVAGEPIEVFGDEWNEDFADNTMTLVDGLYTWTKENVELTANEVLQFKVVKNSNWDTCWPADNYVYTCPADGVYNLTITYNPETNEVVFVAVAQGEEPEMVYTVVGPESIFGTNWDVNDEANNMTEGANGVYTWSKENVTLYGNFDFKVVGNHSYDIYQWPITGNWTANVAEEGIYTIEITFDPEAEPDFRIACNLTKTGNITPVEHVYTVAGTVNLFGSDWNIDDEANVMVKGEDGIYTWTKSGVAFADVDTVEFKVVQDHSWDYAWPAMNWKYYVTEAGTYDFVITFNAETKEITCVGTKQTEPQGVRGDVNEDTFVNITDVTDLINALLNDDYDNINVQNANCNLDEVLNIADVTSLINFLLTDQWPAIEHVYTVAGTPNLFGGFWDVNNTNNDMVKGDDGKYRLNNLGGYFQDGETAEFKIVEDRNWDHAWPAENVLLMFPETGAYNVSITFDPTADQEFDIIRVTVDLIP